MKILHALYSDRKGGLEKAFVNITKAFSKMGHDVELLIPKGAPYVSEIEIPLVHHDFSCNGYYDILFWFRLRILIQKISPDVIVTHNSRATYIVTKAISYTGISVVAFSHGYKTKRFRNASSIIVLTEDMERAFLNDHYDREYINIFPNLIEDLPEFNDYKYLSSREKIKIGYIGRLSDEKGLDDLLYALANVKSNISIELHIAGAGPDKKNILNLASKLDIDSYVYFSGWVENVYSWLNGIDLLVVPSRSESFGIVVLEASACSVPVLASKTPGPLSQITDNEDGWLFKPGDPEDLKLKLEFVLLNMDLWPSIAKKAHSRTRKYLLQDRLDELNSIISRTL